MYTLTEIEKNGLQFVEIRSPDTKSKATICLNQGGRLSNLIFEDLQILADFHPSTYALNYASSILFPFANRIKDGTYNFEDVEHALHCNETDKNNALHGLVHDKTFQHIDTMLSADFGAITLQFTHDGTNKGFPFKFHILLTYTLRNKDLNLTVKIINKDDKTFPFTLGWHPYFLSRDLDSSALKFEGRTKFICDSQQVVCGSIPFDIAMPYQLKDVILDDGFTLESNTVEFFTPEYHLKMTTSSKENYLQLYTPNVPNVIAIEPMTGAPDSFNNKMGLQTIKPRESYQTQWNITFKKRIGTRKLTT